MPNGKQRQPGYPLQAQATPNIPTTVYRAPSSWIGRAGPNGCVEDWGPRLADAVDLPVPPTPAAHEDPHQSRQEPQSETVRIVTMNPTEQYPASDLPRSSISLPSDPPHHYIGDRYSGETAPGSTTRTSNTTTTGASTNGGQRVSTSCPDARYDSRTHNSSQTHGTWICSCYGQC